MRMRTIALNGSGTRVSALGFGCSAMMGRVGRSASLAALAAAYDAGITFFDTARSYGYGESEALLGVFLQGRREAVVVSTKFGILPTPAGVWKRSLKPVARRLLKLAPGVRGAMQRQIAAQFSGGHFSVDALHASLETSLRALRTDYVDMLFLHEPPASVLQQEDLFATLERLVSAGKVRGFGIASSPAVMDAALACKSAGLHALQFPGRSPRQHPYHREPPLWRRRGDLSNEDAARRTRGASGNARIAQRKASPCGRRSDCRCCVESDHARGWRPDRRSVDAAAGPPAREHCGDGAQPLQRRRAALAARSDCLHAANAAITLQGCATTRGYHRAASPCE
jgi:diketogulonate reductase-like aldo/keto reductase